MPDRAVFDETYWVAYRDINVKFALKTIDAITRMQKVNYVYPCGKMTS